MSELQKFYSCAKLVEAAIEAYDKGKPMNPSGVRGHMTIFTYQPTDAEFHGRNVLLGDRIRSTSAPELIYNVNLALSKGLDVDYRTARSMGLQMYVIIKGKRENVQEIPVEAPKATVEAKEATEEPTETLPDVTEEDTGDTIKPEDQETQVVSASESTEMAELDGGQESILPEAECEVEIPASPDWDYANSLKGTENAKKKLEEYALTFNVELDRRKSFDAMLVQFQAGV